MPVNLLRSLVMTSDGHWCLAAALLCGLLRIVVCIWLVTGLGFNTSTYVFQRTCTYYMFFKPVRRFTFCSFQRHKLCFQVTYM